MTSYRPDLVGLGPTRPGGVGTGPTPRPVGTPGTDKAAGTRTPRGTPAAGSSFQRVLEGRLATGRVRFSAHALERLRQAGIHLQGEQQQRLQAAVDKAAAKGARESLVMLDDLALIVSIRNRTVITAVDGERMKDNVFTNIDSAVVT